MLWYVLNNEFQVQIKKPFKLHFTHFLVYKKNGSLEHKHINPFNVTTKRVNDYLIVNFF